MKLQTLHEGRFEADEEQLVRIQQIHDEYYKKCKGKMNCLAYMIVNMNQNLTNYALVQAFKKLSILDFDPNNEGQHTETYKRAAKYASKKGLEL